MPSELPVTWALGLRLSWSHGRSLPLPGSGGGSLEKECLWRRETRPDFKEGFALKGLSDAVLYK